MVIVDLITGFLGAGKTTFLRGYLNYLQNQGEQVRIIENELGDVDVDTQILEDEHCQIADLTGLCMCCVGKDAFIRMLITSAADGCDRILVEPSGIYDVDEFFEVMSLPKVTAVCEIGSILTITDPLGIDYMTREAEYLLFTQLLASGMVIMSKTQLLTEGQIAEATEKLNQLMIRYGCEGGLRVPVVIKSWKDFSGADYEECADAGYQRMVHDREVFNHADTFQSLAFFGRAKDKEDLRSRVESVFHSPSCGWIYRIKGYANCQNGRWYEVNCTSETESIVETRMREENLLVVIGQRLREREIRDELLL